MKLIMGLLFLLSFVANAKQAVIYSEVKLGKLDPATLKYVEEWEISGIIYESLVKPIGAEVTIRPSLAETWEYKNNELKFTLKSNLNFSDGSVLTSKHAVESLKRFLILDSANSSVLKKCLKKDKNIKKPTDKHPSFKIYNSKSFSILIKNGCSNELTKELGQPIYGIVQTKKLGKKLELPYPPIVSGPFMYKVENGELMLERNERNWAWKNSKLKVDAVKFTHKLKTDFDAIRTNKVSIYQKIKDKGYKVIYSLPNITWYLTYDCKKKENCTQKEVILSDLKSSLFNTKLKRKELGIFDMQARSFFPASFNCPEESPKKVKSTKGQCIDFSFGSKRKNENTLKILKAKAEELGYKVDSSCKNKIDFKVYAQYISDEIVPTIDFLSTIARTIPGIEGMKKHLPKSEEGAEYSREKLCKEFSKLNFAPIFHTRTAFFYKMKEIEKIFFKSGGYLYLLDLPFVK